MPSIVDLQGLKKSEVIRRRQAKQLSILKGQPLWQQNMRAVTLQGVSIHQKTFFDNQVIQEARKQQLDSFEDVALNEKMLLAISQNSLGRVVVPSPQPPQPDPQKSSKFLPKTIAPIRSGSMQPTESSKQVMPFWRSHTRHYQMGQDSTNLQNSRQFPRKN